MGRPVFHPGKGLPMAATDAMAGRGAVAVLGAGIMGSAMARNLLSSGLAVTVWDRSASAMASLAEAGAVEAAVARDAVRDVPVVITMLPTGDVVKSVIFDDGVVSAFAQGCVWAQMGTIGVEATSEISARLAELRPDVLFLDAPVSGSKGPAEQGQLLILASGPAAAAETVKPVFSAIGRKTVWLGDAGKGSQVKLVVNAYMSILIEGVAETMELSDRLGVGHQQLAEVIEGGPLDVAPIADAKLHKSWTGADFLAPALLEFPALRVGAEGRGPGYRRRARWRPAAAGRAVSPVARRRGCRARARGCQRGPPGTGRPDLRRSPRSAPGSLDIGGAARARGDRQLADEGAEIETD